MSSQIPLLFAQAAARSPIGGQCDAESRRRDKELRHRKPRESLDHPIEVEVILLHPWGHVWPNHALFSAIRAGAESGNGWAL